MCMRVRATEEETKYKMRDTRRIRGAMILQA